MRRALRTLDAEQPASRSRLAHITLPKSLLPAILGTLLLLSAALYNGYPLTFWDTRVYLESTLDLLPRVDRLIGYAFLLRALSLHGSLWPVVVLQCWLVAWLAWRVARHLRPERGVSGYLLLMLGITGFSAAPWIAGQLMADIFTPILVLALWLVLEDDTLVRWQRAALLALIGFCVAVHLTHLPIGMGLLALAWGMSRLSRESWQRASRRVFAPALALIVGLAAIGSWNASRVGHFTLASGSDAFLLGHLVDSGIAKRVLDDHCDRDDYWLCPYRAQLPMSVDDFLWVDKLNLAPWQHPAEVGRETQRLLRASLRQYPALYLRVALRDTLRVLARFGTGEGLDADARSLIELHLAKLAPHDLTQFRGSRQQRDAIPVARLRAVHTPLGWLLIATMLGLFMRALRAGRNAWSSPSLRFLTLCGGAWLLNALLSANLSGVYDRYESRLVWLFALGCYGCLDASTIRALWAALVPRRVFGSRWRQGGLKPRLVTQSSRTDRETSA